MSFACKITNCDSAVVRAAFFLLLWLARQVALAEPAKPYLEMPERANGPIPSHLSQTGAFRDVVDLVPSGVLIPYDINVSFWSDGAAKTRWISIPNDRTTGNQKIGFAAAGEWTFPKGTVFVKHFELATDERHPDRKHRLETRLLVCDSTGSVYGVTYKWRADNSDADLLADAFVEAIPIKTSSGMRTQNWYYPSRQDCKTCHTDLAGGILGVKTRQLNCNFAYPRGTNENQVRAWNRASLFQPALKEDEISKLPRLASIDDKSFNLEDRARSYLDANCAQCHRPGGTVAGFDTRYDTPLVRQGLIGAPVLIDQGIDGARAIAPNDPWRSIVFMRLSAIDAIKMPPLAHQVRDNYGAELIRDWIKSLPGPAVLDPPLVSYQKGRTADSPAIVLSHSDPGVSIRYTLDGSSPDSSDTLYAGPFKLERPAVVRARAYKKGYTRSISVQEVYAPAQ